jgi:long-chain acyl-CoA synthetase
MLVHELICRGESEQPALINKLYRVSYRQLKENVRKYRDFLYGSGVRPGDNVGLFSKNSVEYVYSYMAVISLGAIVVPLNFQLVPREVAYIVKDANIRTLVTMNRLDLDAALAGVGYTGKMQQLVISDFSRSLDDHAQPPAPSAQINESDICVIIYTSGTTGTPKGAMLSHKNLISNAAAFIQSIPIGKDDNALCVLPMYHCFSWTCSVLATLLRGGAVTVVDIFSRDTVDVIANYGVTIVYGVPSMYGLFGKWNVASELSRVRYFISGGSMLPEQIAEQFYRKYNKRIIEGYGLSEASPVVSVNPPEKPKNRSIGKPLPGVAIRLIDENGTDVPYGEIGELLVSGPNVMAGYYNLPGESARAIRNGWLYTGDLACTDAEGYLYITDRLKDMIITSAENIYPREIEELLYSHPSIQEAAVIGIPDPLRGQTVCAFIVTAEGHAFDKRLLRDYLAANLAIYKVPKEYKQVDSLPKNSTGKILKRVLREQVQNLRIK